MDFLSFIEDYFAALKAALDRVDRGQINEVVNLLVRARDEGRQIFVMGNGGSAATASHFAGDFNKGLSYNRERRFRFICLNDNAPTVLSLANDAGYEHVFVEQLKNFLNDGDIVMAISGSGNSKNVLAAAEYAKAHGASIVGITGYDGGALYKLADSRLHVPVDDMQIAEDVHMVFDHLMMSVICRAGV